MSLSQRKLFVSVAVGIFAAILAFGALTTTSAGVFQPLSVSPGSSMLYDHFQTQSLRQFQLQDSATVEFRRYEGCYLPSEWPVNNPTPYAKEVSAINPLRVLVWCEPFLATLTPTKAELNSSPLRATFLSLPLPWRAELYRRGK